MIEFYVWVHVESAQDGSPNNVLLCSKSKRSAQQIADEFVDDNRHIVGPSAKARVIANIPTYWLAERVFFIANRYQKYNGQYLLPGLYVK